MKRNNSPLHTYWHRRVDGQIRHCMNEHPEWFLFKNANDKETCINSIAKRVVGEIVAVCNVAQSSVGVSTKCVNMGRLSCGVELQDNEAAVVDTAAVSEAELTMLMNRRLKQELITEERRHA